MKDRKVCSRGERRSPSSAQHDIVALLVESIYCFAYLVFSIVTSSFLQASGSSSVLDAAAGGSALSSSSFTGSGSNFEQMLAFSAKYFATNDATGTSLVSDVSTLQMENKFLREAFEKEQYRRRVSQTQISIKLLKSFWVIISH